MFTFAMDSQMKALIHVSATFSYFFGFGFKMRYLIAHRLLCS